MQLSFNHQDQKENLVWWNLTCYFNCAGFFIYYFAPSRDRNLAKNAAVYIQFNVLVFQAMIEAAFDGLGEP